MVKSSHQNMLGRKFLLLLLVKILTIASNSLIFLLLSRKLGPEEIGSYAFVFSFIAIFSFVSELGFNSAHLKKISEGKLLGQSLNVFFNIKSFLALLQILVILAAVAFINFFSLPLKIPKFSPIFFLLLISFFLQNLSLVATLTLEAKREAAKLSLINILQQTVYFLLLIIVFISLPNALGLSLAYFGQVFFLFVLAILVLKNFHFVKPDLKIFKSYATFAFPLVAISIIGAFEYNLEKIMLNNFTTAKNVGLFFTAQKITILILMLSDPMTNLLTSQISYHQTRNQFKLLKNLVSRTQRYLSLFISPLVFYLFFFAGDILPLIFGNKFQGLDAILRLLLLQSFFYTLNRPQAVMLLGANFPKSVSLISILTFLINLSLNFVFIPIFGLAGAGFSIGLSAFFGLCLTSAMAQKNLHFFLPLKSLAIHFVAIFALLSLSHLTTGLIPKNLWQLGLHFLSFILFYVLLLLKIGEIKKSDFEYFLKVLNLKDLSKYVATELKNEK